VRGFAAYFAVSAAWMSLMPWISAVNEPVPRNDSRPGTSRIGLALVPSSDPMVRIEKGALARVS